MEAKTKTLIAFGFVVLCGVLLFVRGLLAEDLNVSATVVDGEVIVRGYTYPGSTVYLNDEDNNTVIGSGVADASGAFTIDVTPFSPGSYNTGVYAITPSALTTETYPLPFTIGAKEVKEFTNISIPPILVVPGSNFAYNATIPLTTYGRPNTAVTVQIDGPVSNTISVTVNSLGVGSYLLSASSLSEGSYTLTPYYVSSIPGAAVSFSLSPAPSLTPTPSLTPSPTLTPSLTPTYSPTPTFTPSPTLSPTPTLTPSPTLSPTPGPTNTPGPAPTDIPVTDTPTPIPTFAVPDPGEGCPLGIEGLCFFDRDESGNIDASQELGSFLSGFESSLFTVFRGSAGTQSQLARFDFNDDDRVDALDLSILLTATSGKANELNRGIDRIHAKLMNLDTQEIQCTNVCKELQSVLKKRSGTVPSTAGLQYALIGLSMFLTLMTVRVITVQLSGIPLRRGFSIVSVLLYFAILTTGSIFLYREYRLQHMVTYGQEETATKAIPVQTDRIRYRVLITAEQPINTVELFLRYNRSILTLTSMETSGSFADLITHMQTSNEQGGAYVLGGVVAGDFVPDEAQFIELEFKRDSSIPMEPRLEILPETRAFPVGATKQTDAIFPNIHIEQVTK